MAWNRALLALVVGLGVVTAATAAHAQADDEERTAAARALFDEGMGFVDEGDLAQAADRFERSLSLRFSPVVAFNLANALVQLERFVESSERLREVIRVEDADPALREAAQAQLVEVLRRIGELTVSVTGAADTVEVRLDGAPLSEALIGVARPLDPGEHRVSVHRDGSELVARTVQVEPGQAATVELEAPPPPEPEPAAAAVPSPGAAASSSSAGALGGPRPLEPRDDGDGALSSPWFWIGVGVAVAAGVVATILLASGAEAQAIGGDFEPSYVEFGR